MKKLGSTCVMLAAIAVGWSLALSAHAAWSFGGTESAANTTVPADASGVAIKSVTGAYSANGGTLPSSAAGTSIVAAGGSCNDAICGTGSANTYGIGGFAGSSWTAGNTPSNLQYYSGGLGMASDSTLVTSPNHAIDNGPATNSSNLISGVGNTEAILLGFDSSVVLSSIGIGWKSGDADISLFRYTGAVTSSTMLSMSGVANSLAGMAAAGWELVGNYGDLSVDTTSPYSTVNASSKGSSWWLISAYNTAYGAATSGTVDQGNDFFKVYAVAGSKCTSTTPGVCGPSTGAPEPASLALVALGLFGAYTVRRRQPVAMGRLAAA